MKERKIGKNPKVLYGTEDTAEEREHKSRRILFLVIILIAVGVLVYFMIFSGFFSVRNINLQSADNVSEEQIKGVIDPMLRGRTWYIFPSDNLLVFSSKKAAREIESQIPQIKNVEVRKRLNGVLEVSIEEREPVMLLGADGVFYALDLNGIVARVSFVEEEGLPIFHSDAEEKFTPHSKALERNMVDFVLDLKYKFHERTSIGIRRLYTPATVSGQVRVETEEGWSVYFDSSKDLDVQLESLLSIMNQKVDENRRQNLEYIDLSTAGWAYIK